MKIVKNLHWELDNFLQRKIDEPGLDITVIEKEIVAVVIRAIIEGGQTEYTCPKFKLLHNRDRDRLSSESSSGHIANAAHQIFYFSMWYMI